MLNFVTNQLIWPAVNGHFENWFNCNLTISLPTSFFLLPYHPFEISWESLVFMSRYIIKNSCSYSCVFSFGELSFETVWRINLWSNPARWMVKPFLLVFFLPQVPLCFLVFRVECGVFSLTMRKSSVARGIWLSWFVFSWFVNFCVTCWDSRTSF